MFRKTCHTPLASEVGRPQQKRIARIECLGRFASADREWVVCMLDQNIPGLDLPRTPVPPRYRTISAEEATQTPPQPSAAATQTLPLVVESAMAARARADAGERAREQAISEWDQRAAEAREHELSLRERALAERVLAREESLLRRAEQAELELKAERERAARREAELEAALHSPETAAAEQRRKEEDALREWNRRAARCNPHFPFSPGLAGKVGAVHWPARPELRKRYAPMARLDTPPWQPASRVWQH